jgi:hypothetical protein
VETLTRVFCVVTDVVCVCVCVKYIATLEVLESISHDLWKHKFTTPVASALVCTQSILNVVLSQSNSCTCNEHTVPIWSC